MLVYANVANRVRKINQCENMKNNNSSAFIRERVGFCLTAYREINHQLLHRVRSVAVTHWRIKTMENIKKTTFML